MPAKSRPAVEPASERATSRKHDPVRFRSRRYSPDGRRRAGGGSQCRLAAFVTHCHNANFARGPRLRAFSCPAVFASRASPAELRTSSMVGYLINRALHAVAVLFGV